jgi:hypothetical protein
MLVYPLHHESHGEECEWSLRAGKRFACLLHNISIAQPDDFILVPTLKPILEQIKWVSRKTGNDSCAETRDALYDGGWDGGLFVAFEGWECARHSRRRGIQSGLIMVESNRR